MSAATTATMWRSVCCADAERDCNGVTRKRRRHYHAAPPSLAFKVAGALHRNRPRLVAHIRQCPVIGAQREPRFQCRAPGHAPEAVVHDGGTIGPFRNTKNDFHAGKIGRARVTSGFEGTEAAPRSELDHLRGAGSEGGTARTRYLRDFGFRSPPRWARRLPRRYSPVRTVGRYAARICVDCAQPLTVGRNKYIECRPASYVNLIGSRAVLVDVIRQGERARGSR